VSNLARRIEQVEAQVGDMTTIDREAIEAIRAVMLDDDSTAQGKAYSKLAAARAKLAQAAASRSDRYTDYLLNVSRVLLDSESAPGEPS
jgi:hypothetical protein